MAESQAQMHRRSVHLMLMWIRSELQVRLRASGRYSPLEMGSALVGLAQRLSVMQSTETSERKVRDSMIATTHIRSPLVSVTIPVFNGQATVAHALHSVLTQTHRNLEVIVVDDGSTDATWEVLKSFGASIRVIRQPNSGISAARNAGVLAAQGEFIALMDHDDVCAPERIAAQVKFLNEQQQIALCCSDFSAFDSAGPVSNSHTATYYNRCCIAAGGIAARYPERGQIDISCCLPEMSSEPVVIPTYFGNVYEELALGNFVHPPTVMFRREVLKDAGLFEPGTRSSGDWGWLVKVARIGGIGFIDRPLLRYRLSGTQISSSERALIDALQVAHRICARDPSLVERQPARFQELFAELYAGAADARADKHPIEALSLLAVALFRYRAWSWQTPRTLFKILTPSPLLQRLRSHREHNQLVA